MRQYTSDEIQDQFNKLPKVIQEAITSTDVNDKIEEIGKKYGLHVDQIGELVDQVGLVMLGLERSGSFVGDASSRLSINSDIARQVADDINTEIFSVIKRSARESADAKDAERLRKVNDISAIERAGGFSIEKDSIGHNDDSAPQDHHISDNEQALTAIENQEDSEPASSQETKKIYNSITPPSIYTNTPGIRGNLPSMPAPPASEASSKTEPLIDQLLSGPMAQPEQKIVQDKTRKPAATPQEAKKSDLYREEV